MLQNTIIIINCFYFDDIQINRTYFGLRNEKIQNSNSVFESI